MNILLILIIVVVLIVVVIAAVLVSTNNALVRLNNQCDEGFATMDVYLKKRYDLIPNLVETVKGYAKHESETLENVIAARNAAVAAGNDDVAAKNQKENAFGAAVKQLFAIAEAYPDLKANANFTELQKQLRQIEEDIANARKYYNATVREYNNKIQMFPSSIVASANGYTVKPYFEAASSEREAVKVQF